MLIFGLCFVLLFKDVRDVTLDDINTAIYSAAGTMKEHLKMLLLSIIFDDISRKILHQISRFVLVYCT